MDTPTARLRARMDKHKMNQSDLARELGVTRSCVSRWMLGLSKPSRRTAERIEKAVGLPREVWS
jgi:transcriptional regulator with XRE-family HTH domain